MAKLLMKLWQKPNNRFNHVLDKCTYFIMPNNYQPIHQFIEGFKRYTYMRLSIFRT